MTELKIFSQDALFPTAKDLYGLFFEDINRAGDGGLYPEMIRNRAFEDSIPPEEVTLDAEGYSFTSDFGWKAIFNHGEGLTKWVRQNKTPETPVPAWYVAGGAEMELNRGDPLNGKRLAALDVRFGGGEVYNIGYAGIAQEKGKQYRLNLFAKAVDKAGTLRVSVRTEAGETAWQTEVSLKPGAYERFEGAFEAEATGYECRLVLEGDADARLGFVSLMPEETYKGHGLRKDLVELYAGIHPRFVRFPGGCIVEGFTFGTMNRFHNSIGPVWERPSQYLLWHYRTTNGLGFHEFLQLCEDLEAEPLYVCNCGIVCQGRSHEHNFLEGDELKGMLQDTIDAIEYATAPADTPMGALRAAAGHPAPFKMRYIEIGNENNGPLYLERYEYFRRELAARYPEMIFVANTHVEKDGLKTDIVDEHFYSDVNFFAEQLHHYDGYDRKGPGVFVGELAVNVADTGNLRAALGEAMFFIGMERNQDIVKLASYAPMNENIHFAAWAPNLIAFDNHRSYGIPSYYIWKLFGSHRGDRVIRIEEKTPEVYRYASGMPSITGNVGTRFKNTVYNGQKVAPYRHVLGYAVEDGDGYVVKPGDESQAELRYLQYRKQTENCLIILGDDEGSREGRFECDVLPAAGKPLGIGIFSARWEKSWYDKGEEMLQREWDYRFTHPFQWIVENGVSRILDTGYYDWVDLCEPVALALSETAFTHVAYEADAETIRVYVEGKLIQTAKLPHRQKTASVVTETDDEVIVKTVNLSAEAEEMQISLDCEVEDRYRMDVLYGDPEAMNDIDHGTNVCDQSGWRNGAAREFVYCVGPYMASVITLKKRK